MSGVRDLSDLSEKPSENPQKQGKSWKWGRSKRRASERRKSRSGKNYGDVAQLGERLVCNQEVAGSIPVVSIPKAIKQQELTTTYGWLRFQLVLLGYDPGYDLTRKYPVRSHRPAGASILCTHRSADNSSEFKPSNKVAPFDAGDIAQTSPPSNQHQPPGIFNLRRLG
jgi:hypothetical protein